MTTLRTAAQQALEAWQTATYGHPSHHKATLLAMTALSTAVAQQAEPVDVGLLEYRGNSVAFIHQKMTAYRAGIDAAWDAFRAKGLHPDGKTPLANMIAKYTAPPQRQPLTEEEILKAIGWERAEMYMKLTPNFPIEEARKETIKNARAIERVHGIGEQS